MIFKTIEDTLPHVQEFVEATDFEMKCIRKDFKGVWNTIPVALGHDVNGTAVTFRFAYIGATRLVAFYNPTGLTVNWADVDGFIRSFGKRKTKAEHF